MSILNNVIDAAMHPLTETLGWHGLAYGLVTKKLLDTLRSFKDFVMEWRGSTDKSGQQYDSTP